MNIFAAAKRLATLTAALVAAGVDPDSPDLVAAIAAKMGSRATEEAPGTETKPAEVAPTAAPVKTPEELAKEKQETEQAEAVARRDRNAASFERLAAQAKAEGMDLEALAQNPEGFQVALREKTTQAAQAAVAQALRENAPQATEHVEAKPAALASWQTHAMLIEQGKTQEAAEFFAKNSDAIMGHMQANPGA